MSEAAVEILCDRDLLCAFRHGDGDGDEVLTAALLREIERRGLDRWRRAEFPARRRPFDYQASPARTYT